MAVIMQYMYNPKRINRTFLKGVTPGDWITINNIRDYHNLINIEERGVITKVQDNCINNERIFVRIRDSIIGEKL